jgi:hypothetical protein
MPPAVETIAYKLTEEERNEARRISNSLESNYVLAHALLTHKRRKAEYTSALRELRGEIPLNFTQFTVFPEDEPRPRKRRRIASDTNDSEDKDFDYSDFVQNYAKFRPPHPPNFSGKDEKEWKAWITGLEQYFVMLGARPKHSRKINIASAYLKNDANIK